MNQMELGLMRLCPLDQSAQNPASVQDPKCQSCWPCNGAQGSPLRVIPQQQIPKNNNPSANPGNCANNPNSPAATTARPKRDFRFQVIQVRQGPKWFILPSKHHRDDEDDNENGNAPRLSPKKNASSDQENQEMLSPTSPCSPLSPTNAQDPQLPFAMDNCGNQSCKAVACGSEAPKNTELKPEGPAMVSVTATKQIADFPSPLSEPTTRRFPPAAGNRFQVIRNVSIPPAQNSSQDAGNSNEIILSSSKSSSTSPEPASCITVMASLEVPSNLAVLVDSSETKGVNHSETNNLSVQSNSSMNSLTYSSTSSGCSTAPSLMGQAMENNGNASDSNIFERSLTGSAFEILAVSRKDEDEEDDFEEDDDDEGIDTGMRIDSVTPQPAKDLDNTLQ